MLGTPVQDSSLRQIEQGDASARTRIIRAGKRVSARENDWESDTVKVILRVTNGPQANRCVMLVHDQTLEVGRAEWSNICCGDDHRMSGEHFTLSVYGDSCVVRDRNSTNGTFLNGELVTESYVVDKDLIQAGDTIFQVDAAHLRNSWPEGEPLVKELLRTTLPSAAPVTSQVSPTYFVEARASGIYRWQPEANGCEPSTISRILSQSLRETAIIDLNKVPEETIPQLPRCDLLYGWLEQEVGYQSPRVFTETEPVIRSLVTDAVWGQDAILYVYSTSHSVELLEHLRQNSPTFARPSLLEAHLAFAESGHAAGLLDGIEAVLVESEEGKSWSLYSYKNMSPLLAAAGMQQARLSTQAKEQNFHQVG